MADAEANAVREHVGALLANYQRTLQSDRRHLLEYFPLVDDGDGTEPLFLQAKEAEPSVLTAYAGRSLYRNQGQRVAAGQHLIQAESDIFVRWTHETGPDGADRHYYVREMKDWKSSVPIERVSPSGLKAYARLCGWTLARAHARSGDRIALAAAVRDGRVEATTEI